MGGIIWLTSYPKSGNTWARTFINNLLLDPEEPVDINTISSLAPGDARKSWYEKAGGQPFDRYSMGQVIGLRPKVHQVIAQSQEGRVFVKTHSLYGNIHGVPQITLEYTAGAIYIIRNPLDVVISLSSHFGLSLEQAIDLMNDPEGGLDETREGGNIRQYFGSWSGHANSWTHFNPQQMHLMRYEDMLDKPFETFGGMARFLGIDPSDGQLKKAIEFSSFDAVRRQEDEKGFREQSDKNEKFFRVGKSGQWKDVLSDEQVNRIVDCHHQAMKRYGYLPE
ncbi:MAG: sulfotransferase domain-containing protein [Sneathiella sp.]|nr:sulfotransferase domain-containing protein [Sneathiella sp.]